MAKAKPRSSLEAPLGWVEVEYKSWDEWFAAQVEFHKFTGMSYDALIPPAALLKKLGPMPVPPWLK